METRLPRSRWLLLLLCASFVCAQETTPPASTNPQEPATTQTAPAEEPEQKPAENESAQERAWEIIQRGVHNKSAERRAKSVGVLGLVPHNRKILEYAEAGLKDSNPTVRSAAANALGEMRSRSSIPLLKVCLDDEEPGVVLACAKALLEMKDRSAYDVYYAVLTGDRKTQGSLIHEQMKVLKNPKQIAALGIEEGIGFVPFAGMGYTAYKMLSKDEVSPVRAAAARALVNDPDPQSSKALADAVGDKSWIVRKAALDAIAKRGDAKLLKAAVPAMEDDKDIVMYTAAAAVIELSGRPNPPRNVTGRKKGKK